MRNARAPALLRVRTVPPFVSASFGTAPPSGANGCSQKRRVVNALRGRVRVGDEMLVNLFAFALDFPVAEKQSLLEVATLEARAVRLIETLEFHALEREFSPGIEQAKFRVQ